MIVSLTYNAPSGCHCTDTFYRCFDPTEQSHKLHRAEPDRSEAFVSTASPACSEPQDEDEDAADRSE